jgi:hypothetical protein
MFGRHKTGDGKEAFLFPLLLEWARGRPKPLARSILIPTVFY